MLKRVLISAGLAGALFAAAPTAAFAFDHDGWRHGGSGCGSHHWDGHRHHHHHHGDNWNRGWNHSNDGWNCGWNHSNDGWNHSNDGWNGWSGL